MRVVACAAVSLAVLALAACGSDGGPRWPGPPEAEADGTVAVEDFAMHQDGVDEPWERYTPLAASEFLRLDKRTAATTTIEAQAGGEGSGPHSVTITLDGLLDDSVRAERWTLRFEPDGEEFRLVSASRTQRCQPERGHQDFTTEPCV